MVTSRLLVCSIVTALLPSLIASPSVGAATAHRASSVSPHLLAMMAAAGSAAFSQDGNSEKPKNNEKASGTEELPDGKGKDVTQRVCSGCHAVTVFAKQRHTPDEWASIVDNMISKGLEASDSDLDTISNYLNTSLGKQNPSTAPPSDSNSSH